MSHGPGVHSDLSQAVVSTGVYCRNYMLTGKCHNGLIFALARGRCLMCARAQSTDSWKHFGAAEEVAVHPVLGSERRARGVREG